MCNVELNDMQALLSTGAHLRDALFDGKNLKFIELKEKLRSGAIKLGESMHCVVGIDILAGS